MVRLLVFMVISLVSISYAGLSDILDISKAGMSAQNEKMQAIAENIANIDTNQTASGEPYVRKKVLIFTDKENKPQARTQRDLSQKIHKVYNPGNPNADAFGFVIVPDISLSQEMTDLSMTSKIYEANLAAYSSTMKVIQELINIGK